MLAAPCERCLEAVADLSCDRSRGDVVRSRKRRKEVIESVLVGQVDSSNPKADLAFIAMEEVVFTKCDVEQTALLNAGRIVIVVFCSWGGNVEQRRSELGCKANAAGYRACRRCFYTTAGEAGLKLLIGREAGEVNRRLAVDRQRISIVVEGEVRASAIGIGGVVAGSCACHESTVVAPVEAEPGALAEGQVVLQVGGLVEPLVVVDAERGIRAGSSGVAPTPPTCGLKKRAATDDMTTKALTPWVSGTLARRAKPGIFEFFHSMGNVMGVAPKTEKS